jgi:hypothetical protein
MERAEQPDSNYDGYEMISREEMESSIANSDREIQDAFLRYHSNLQEAIRAMLEYHGSRRNLYEGLL